MAIPLIFVLVAVLSGASIAGATHFDNIYTTPNYNPTCIDQGPTPGTMFCQTDNASVTVWREASLSVTGKANIATTLNNDFAPTDLVIIFASTPSYSGSAETDIIFQRRTDIPEDFAGWAWCDDAVSSTKCDQHYAAFEGDYGITPSVRAACHETGHTVGLTHGAQASPPKPDSEFDLGCMGTNLSNPGLGSHNSQQINATY